MPKVSQINDDEDNEILDYYKINNGVVTSGVDFATWGIILRMPIILEPIFLHTHTCYGLNFYFIHVILCVHNFEYNTLSKSKF